MQKLCARNAAGPQKRFSSTLCNHLGAPCITDIESIFPVSFPSRSPHGQPSSLPPRLSGCERTNSESSVARSRPRAEQETRSAGDNSRREFLLGQADAGPHAHDHRYGGWRGLARHRGMVRPRLQKADSRGRSEGHTSELQSPCNLGCRLLLEKKK